MSHALVTAEFADGTYSFALYMGQWEELQEITGLGPREICLRLLEGKYRARWPREIHRLGLIGAGMKPVDAKRLVEQYCDTQPFDDLIPLAVQVCAKATVRPASDEEVKKKEAVNGAMATDGYDFRSSTATGQ